MKDFENKTVIVTGAASGIGFEMAKLFAEQKMNVVLADIEQSKLDEAVKAVNTAAGCKAIGVLTDVGSADSVESLCKTALESFGSFQIVCNNAGVYTGGYVWEQTEEDFEWLMRVNQWGVIHGIRFFVPQMMAQADECHVVNTASMAALCTLPLAGIYHMTKHAVLALSECLYHDLSLAAPQIKVSCLCPELVNTGIAGSGRNRPTTLAKQNPTEASKMSMDAIIDATRDSLAPKVLAERVLQAIKDEQFYILPPEGNAWRVTSNARLDDIRAVRNPVMTPPDI